ncbi:hypothetical protein L585_13500 [Pantoea ananatis BRT175]|uniref:hypothetical protein n=1 Tax=Pantoea ananas TaxID=553 RepID=UPI0003B1F92C|nr:hypothetical protein [Pantoea ananatis]ERM13490.1 hypothetical protein L585_13500 [Pantoea ananatis BRT175]
MPGFSGGVGSSVGGAAGDNGSMGGGAGTSKSWNSSKPGSVSFNGGTASTLGGWDTVSDTRNRGGGGNNNSASSNGGNSGNGAASVSNSAPALDISDGNFQRQQALMQQYADYAPGGKFYGQSGARVVAGRAAYATAAAAVQQIQQARSQQSASQPQGDNGEAQRQAGAAQQAAAAAEAARQQRIQAETAQRQSLQQQLGSTDSIEATRDLVNKINGLGSEADNAAALNKSLLDSANSRLSLQTEAQKNNAIGSAQSAQQGQSASAATGPNTALYSSKISQAVGTPISLSDQQANTDEAARMGGYNDTSSFGKIRSVARAALGGLGVAGPVGGLLSGAAAVYSNFISDRQNASSRALTTGTAASKAGIGDVLAGMVKGGLTGAALGPFGALAGLVAGGAMASGTAPTADDLKGVNPLNNGVTQDKSSYGPGQTLANGQRVGQGNANDYKPGSLGSVFAGGGYNPAPVNPAPSTGSGGTTSPGSSTGTGNSGIDDRNKAGQSAFSSFIDDLRKRQMNNLLYTNAGWNGTSGTSLLGRVSGSQGAIGGLSGQVISQYGGGRSLLGGAWSF